FIKVISKLAPSADVVIVHDFGHGLLTTSARKTLIEHSRFLAVNTQSNSANLGYNLISKYHKADYICVDEPQAHLAVGDKTMDLPRIVSEALPNKVTCQRIIVTQGRHGCITFDQGAGVCRIPAFTETAFDTMGAGDAFLAITAPLVACGTPIELVG